MIIFYCAVVFILVILLIYSRGPSIERSERRTSIKKLVRQTARWSTAAEQDENAMIAVLHANYGAGYLWAVKDIATPAQIMDATGVDVQTLEAHVTTVQDNATRKMATLCPGYAPKDSYLSRIAGQ